jgi:hypothetical protein
MPSVLSSGCTTGQYTRVSVTLAVQQVFQLLQSLRRSYIHPKPGKNLTAEPLLFGLLP